MSLLIQLRQKIAATISNELKPARERIRSATNKNQADLASVREELSRRRGEIRALETATPTELVRRGLTAEGAVAESDKLAQVVSSLEEKERALFEKVSGERSAIETDFRVIRELLTPLTDDTSLLLQAELAALVCSITDPDQDVLHQFSQGGFDRFWPLSIVASIMHDRRRLITHAETQEQILSVADQILADPIPKLKQAPEELPNHPNAQLIQWIGQALRR
jgi:hypothetical protein